MGGAIYNANYGMGEPTYGLLLSLIMSLLSRLVQRNINYPHAMPTQMRLKLPWY